MSEYPTPTYGLTQVDALERKNKSLQGLADRLTIENEELETVIRTVILHIKTTPRKKSAQLEAWDDLIDILTPLDPDLRMYRG